MTQAVRLRSRQFPRELGPQCCAPWVPQTPWVVGYPEVRHKQRAEKLGFDPKRCIREGSVEIDGQPYCTQHAGKLALHLLLGEELDWSTPTDREPR